MSPTPSVTATPDSPANAPSCDIQGVDRSNNPRFPLAGMTLEDKEGLLNTPGTLTIIWTDADTQEQHAVTDVPKQLLLAFAPSFSRFRSWSNNDDNVANWDIKNSKWDNNVAASNEVYDLGLVSHLAPNAVRYVITSLVTFCRSPPSGDQPGDRDAIPAPYSEEPTNVLRHLKCFIAAKRLGVRCVDYGWRGALMDAVRAANVTAAEFILLHKAFGETREPLLLRHVLHCVAYAELTDEQEHPETLRINRYVYGSQPSLAPLKKAVEVEVETKLVAQEEKQRAWEERRREREERKERRERLGKERERRHERWLKRQERIEQARRGERVLSEKEVEAMGRYAGPSKATVSGRLR